VGQSLDRPLFGVDYCTDTAFGARDEPNLHFSYECYENGHRPISDINSALIRRSLIKEEKSQAHDRDHQLDAICSAESDASTPGREAQSRTCRVGSRGQFDPCSLRDTFLMGISDLPAYSAVKCQADPAFYSPANEAWVQTSLMFYSSIDQRLSLGCTENDFTFLPDRFTVESIDLCERAVGHFYPSSIAQGLEWQDYCVLFQVADLLSTCELDLANALRHMLHFYPLLASRDNEDRFDYNIDYIVGFIVGCGV
jgi:hypothetical protein